MRSAAISVAELWKLKDDPQHKLPKNRKILLCCEYGNTSMYAAKRLTRQGYQIYTLIGGLNALNG